MKSLIFILLITTTSFAGIGPRELFAPVEHVYVPAGFDANDDTEVIIAGELPNLCYQSPFEEVEIRGFNIYIDIKLLDYSAKATNCPQVVVPYTMKVSLGVLPQGDYQIYVNQSSLMPVNADITIEPEYSIVVNDFIYAHVEDIHRSSADTVTISGAHPADCFELDEIVVFNNGSDTYSVLPKLNQTQELCSRVLVPFEYELEVPQDLHRHKVLLHVRTMIGTSVNMIFNN